jgi:hypothetical protein
VFPDAKDGHLTQAHLSCKRVIFHPYHPSFLHNISIVTILMASCEMQTSPIICSRDSENMPKDHFQALLQPKMATITLPHNQHW